MRNNHLLYFFISIFAIFNRLQLIDEVGLQVVDITIVALQKFLNLSDLI